MINRHMCVAAAADRVSTATGSVVPALAEKQTKIIHITIISLHHSTVGQAISFVFALCL